MTQPDSTDDVPTERLRQPGVAYLLSVLGTVSSQRWQRRMAELGLDPREVVVLRMVAAEPGRSQRSLAPALQVRPSHLVAVIDALQERQLVERRRNSDDRRAHALHLTRRGSRLLARVMRVSSEHERDLTASLDDSEVKTLERLLARIADTAGAAHGGHPGFDDPD